MKFRDKEYINNAGKVQHKMHPYSSPSSVWTPRSSTKEERIFQRPMHLRVYYSLTNSKAVSCEPLTISVSKNLSRKYLGLLCSDLWFAEPLIHPQGGVEVMQAI